jgi:hypothetical protein
MCPRTGKRRILEVRELGGIADETIRQRSLFKYEVRDGLVGWAVGGRSSMFELGATYSAGLTALPSFIVAEGIAQWV